MAELSWDTSSGNWFIPHNWAAPNSSPSQFVPGATDVALILDLTGIGTPFTIDYAGVSTIASLTGAAAATINITSGSLTIGTGSSLSRTQFSLASGTTLTVQSGQHYTQGMFAGTLAGNGTLLIGAGATTISTADISIAGLDLLDGAVVALKNDLDYQGAFHLREGAHLDLGGFSLSLHGPGAIEGSVEGFNGSNVLSIDGAFINLSYASFGFAPFGSIRLNGTSEDSEIIGSHADDLIQTGAGADGLYGGEGVDVLVAGAGVDILDGGFGNDYMLGGEGDDTYHVDDTFDLVDEDVVFVGFGHGGFDTIISSANWYWDVYSIGERLIVADDVHNATIVGSLWSNEMIGNRHANYMFGRGGSDTYRPGEGFDWISLSTLGATDENAYVGVDGNNTIIVDVPENLSYDIIFEFESGKDKVDISVFEFESADQVFAAAFDDEYGNTQFLLRTSESAVNIVWFIGLSKADIAATDFII